eukprot:1155729-Pelagomonas_calceolata.AAC.2
MLGLLSVLAVHKGSAAFQQAPQAAGQDSVDLPTPQAAKKLGRQSKEIRVPSLKNPTAWRHKKKGRKERKEKIHCLEAHMMGEASQVASLVQINSISGFLPLPSHPPSQRSEQ